MDTSMRKHFTSVNFRPVMPINNALPNADCNDTRAGKGNSFVSNLGSEFFENASVYIRYASRKLAFIGIDLKLRMIRVTSLPIRKIVRKRLL